MGPDELIDVAELRPGNGDQWYVNVNDLVGGFCIGIQEGPLSENQLAASVADMINEKEARLITALHNATPALLDLAEAARVVSVINHEQNWEFVGLVVLDKALARFQDSDQDGLNDDR